MARSTCFVAALGVLLSTPALAADIEAMGGSYQEQVISIDDQGGRLMVHTRRRQLPLESVKAIRFQRVARAAGASRIQLIGGDALLGAIEGGDEESIGLRSEALGARTLPLEQVRAVLPSVEADRERALLAHLKAGEEIDWVRLRSGGTVKGSVASIDGTRISIDTDVEGGSGMDTMSFDFAKVEMVSVAPLGDPPAPSEDLRVVLRLTDGSTLTGKLVKLTSGAVQLEHPLGGGKAVEIPISKLAELIVRGGLFVYLSDMAPVSVKQEFPPEFDFQVDLWGYKRDTNVTGGKLRLGGRAFEKGLGVHSHCALTYALDGKFREFRSQIGLDDSTRYLGEPGFGAVVFQVLLDGEPAKEYPTGVVKRKGDKPTEVVVNVTGKKTITLVAGFDPTSLHVLGRADWADAHLIRKR